jgi:HK97 gp10 family phage protein
LKRVKGSAKLLGALRRLPGAMLDGIAAELEGALPHVVEDAQAGAAVDTGYMRDHIYSEVVREEGAVVGKAVSEADYSVFVELGTYKVAAQPFLLPAAIANEARIAEAVGRGARRGAEGVANGTA